MNTRTKAWLFLMSAAAAGCTQEVEGNPPGETQVGEGRAALRVVFEEYYSETGRFRIYRNTDGDVAMSVTGAIGKDDPAAIGKLLDPSFVATYQHLRPSVAKVPDRLVALEKERKPVQTRPLEMDPQALPLADETPEDFLNTVCKSFIGIDGSWNAWHPRACFYTASGTSVPVPHTNTNQRVYPQYGEVSFFWNMSSNSVTHSLWDPWFYWFYNDYPIPPWTWGWDSWPAGNPPGWPDLGGSPNDPPGEMGVTSHWRETRI